MPAAAVTQIAAHVQKLETSGTLPAGGRLLGVTAKLPLNGPFVEGSKPPLRLGQRIRSHSLDVRWL